MIGVSKNIYIYKKLKELNNEMRNYTEDSMCKTYIMSKEDMDKYLNNKYSLKIKNI